MPLNFLNTGYFADKVGIGTESPFSPLQVGQATFTGANGMVNDSRVGISNHGSLTGMMLASTYNDATYPEYGLVFIQGPSTSSYNVWSISPDGPAKGSGLSFIYKADATNIHNQTPQVYFEGSTGYVGIGTSSPGAKLEIKDGDLWLNGTTSNYNPEIFFIDDAGPTGIAGAKIRYENNNGNLYFDHKWDTATSGFFFRNRVDGTALNTMSLVNGKVGIEIDTPQAPLSFANVAGNKIDFYYNTTTNDRYGIQVQASELRIHSGEAGDSTGGITFGKDDGTTFTEAMRIRNDGNVGIGTASPTSQLSIGANAITTKKPTVIIADGVAGGSLVIRGLSPILSFDRTGASPENKILMDGAGLEFKTGTLDAEGDVDFKIKLDGKLQAPAYTQGFLQSDANGNIEISGGGTLPGGPYLPLSAGSSYPLTGELHVDDRVIIENTTNLTTGVVDSLLIKTLSSGTSITNGFGGGLSFYLENTVYSAVNEVGKIAVIETDTIAIDDKMVFSVKDNNILAERLTLTGQEAVFTGNVGIGNTNPSEKLEVVGNIKITAALLLNQENTNVDTGTEAIASVVLATYTAAFFDFVIKKGTNVRSGTVYACHDGTNVEFTETSTQDLGDTSDVTLNVVISTIYLQLQATTTSDDWSVKSLIRAI